MKYPLFLIATAFFILKLILFKIKKIEISRLSNLFIVFSGLIFVITAFLNNYWLGGTIMKYKIFDCYILIWFITLLIKLLENKKIDFLLILGLFSILFSGSLGTNDGLSSHFLFYAVFIFLGIHHNFTFQIKI